MKYYLVSYAQENGFGNMFVKTNKYLDIREAEKTIQKNNKLQKKPIIITINEINKTQYIEKS